MLAQIYLNFNKILYHKNCIIIYTTTLNFNIIYIKFKTLISKLESNFYIYKIKNPSFFFNYFFLEL